MLSGLDEMIRPKILAWQEFDLLAVYLLGYFQTEFHFY
jgi:hypothetical protein